MPQKPGLVLPTLSSLPKLPTSYFLPPTKMKHVVLLGMMGVGKSTVGRYLAHCLGRERYDLDEEIERRESRTISEIFQTDGEAYFRQQEAKVLIELLDDIPAVISLGGGTFMNERLRDLMKEEAVTFYLQASIQNLARRVGNGASRPLLQGGSIKEKLQERLEERDPIYSLADFIIPTDNRPATHVGEHIIEHREAFD